MGSRNRLHTSRVPAGLIALAAFALVGVGLALLRPGDNRTAAASPQIGPTASSSPPVVDVTWRTSGGVPLPVTRTHGPRDTSDGLARGFVRSDVGAALAAAHLLIRTGPTVGSRVFDPTITAQATGANAAALKLAVKAQYEQLRMTAAVPVGDPVPGADAQLVGYLLGGYDGSAGTASVDVVLTSPELAQAARLLQVTVSLRWMSDDWRVVAPPNGDWSRVSTPVSAAPAGLLSYSDIG